VTEKLSFTESTQRLRWTAWTLVTGDTDSCVDSSSDASRVINNIMLDTLLSGPNLLHAIEKTERACTRSGQLQWRDQATS